MRKILLLAFLLPLFLKAQNNYKPGFAVDLKGDTLRGVIDYKEWGTNPFTVKFIDNKTPGAVTLLTPANTNAFGVNSLEFYKSFVLTVSQDQVELEKLANKLDTTTVTDTVFLRLNSKGKFISLYSYTDAIKPRFYILNAGETQPQELIYHAYYNADNSSSVQYVTRYRSQLENISQQHDLNTPALETAILQAAYKEPDLVKIVKTINGSTGDQFSSESLSGIRWFAGVGGNFSTIKFDLLSNPSSSGGIFNASSAFPKIAAGLDFFENKKVQTIQLRLELSATMNQYDIEIVNSGSPASTSTLNFKQFNSALTPQIIYNVYNRPELKIFLGAGAALNFSSYNKYAFITNYGGSFASTVKDAYPPLSTFWISFPLRVGIAINNKVEINACYMPSSSLTKDNTESVNASSFQVGVNFLF